MPVMLRPLTLGELLDRGFQLYRSRFGVFVGIAAVAYLPLFVVQATGLWTPKTFTGSATALFGLGLLFTALLHLLAVAAAHAATIVVVSAAYLERPITLSQAYGKVSGMLLRVFFVMVGMGIGVGIGTLLLIIPGVILFLMWGLAIPVAVLEEAGLSESLSRSRQLTAGHRSRVFVIYLLYFALVMALETGLMVPLGALIAIKGHAGAAAAILPIMTVGTAILSYLVECLVTPVLTISLSLMYYDERVRKEAFDIQLMINALRSSPAQSAAAGAS